MHLAEIHWTAQSSYPILATLQLLPLLAVPLLLSLRKRSALYAVAIGLALAELLLSITLYQRFNPLEPSLQFTERLPLLPILGYHAAVDGMSAVSYTHLDAADEYNPV